MKEQEWQALLKSYLLTSTTHTLFIAETSWLVCVMALNGMEGSVNLLSTTIEAVTSWLAEQGWVINPIVKETSLNGRELGSTVAKWPSKDENVDTVRYAKLPPDYLRLTLPFNGEEIPVIFDDMD